MDWTRAFSGRAAAADARPVTFAIPFFLLLLIIEWAAARKLAHTEAERAPAGAYLKSDAWASIWMGLVSVATSGVLNAARAAGATPRSTSTSRRGTCRPTSGTRG